jgi:hypothetical protein
MSDNDNTSTLEHRRSSYWTVVQTYEKDNVRVEVSRAESNPPKFGVRVGYRGTSGQPGGWIPVVGGSAQSSMVYDMMRSAEEFVVAELRLWEKAQSEKRATEEAETARRMTEARLKGAEERRKREHNLAQRAEENRARARGGSGKKGKK